MRRVSTGWAQVCSGLATVTDTALHDERRNPRDRPQLSALILEESWDHLRLARRELDAINPALSDAPSRGANKGFRSPSVSRSWHTDPGVDHTSEVVIDPGDYFELTMEELREVARFAVQSAEEVLGMFEEAKPGDPRPRAAVGAAWEFVNGAGRTNLQRATAMDAHRAAKEAPSAAAKHAAHAAGDAAAAAYLHPFAKADQVGHILRSSAHAARAAELLAGGDPLAGPELVGRAATRATPGLVDVLRRYPPAPTGKSRVAVLMSLLDDTLRRR